MRSTQESYQLYTQQKKETKPVISLTIDLHLGINLLNETLTVSSVDIEGLNPKVQRVFFLAWNDVLDALLLQIEFGF